MLYRLSYSPAKTGGSGEIRTLDQEIKSLLLYRLSYRPRLQQTLIPTSSKTGREGRIRTYDWRDKHPVPLTAWRQP